MPIGPFDPIPAKVGNKQRRVYLSDINELREALSGMQDAYDVAVAEGFAGTRAEWLDSLVGEGAGAQEGESAGTAVAGIVLPHPSTPDTYVETAIGVKADGRWSDYSIGLTEEQLNARGNLTSGLAATTALLTPNQPYGDGRMHPTLTKPLDAPILAFADQSATTMFWPYLVDLRVSGGSGVMLLYSTDHGSGGIYAATADTPLGPYTDQGLIFTSGSQCETPSAIWNPVTDLWHLFYHTNPGDAADTRSQTTRVATSPDLVTFTDIGVIDSHWSDVLPDTGHNGYFVPFRIGGGWYGWSADGDGAMTRVAFWYSDDGLDWTYDPRPLSKFGRTPPGATELEVDWPRGTPLVWGGRNWWLGTLRPVFTHASVDQAFGVLPLGPDFRSAAGQYIDITPPVDQAWEGDRYTWNGNILAWDGHLYMPYRAGTTGTIGVGDWWETGSFGLMEVV